MGKVLSSSAARAARPVANASAGQAEALSVESLGWELRSTLPPLRLHSVSVYDAQGNVLWLSEGALGPDEHSLVVEALEGFSGADARGGCENRLEDGRIAVFLPARAPQGRLAGLVMILADQKAAGDELVDRIATAAVHALLSRLAELMRPAAGRAADPDPTSLVLSLAEEGPSPAESARSAPQRGASQELAPAAVEAILERGELSLELESAPSIAPPPPLAPAAAASIAAPAAPLPGIAEAGTTGAIADQAAVVLDVFPFVRLRNGGRMRRFEVLPRGTPRQNRDPAALDVRAVDRLLAWLADHRAAWTQEPTSFTLDLSIATLKDDRFLRHLTAALSRSGISPDTVGFEIAEPLCTQRRAQVERFIGGCDRLGCFIVIDGFSFDSAVVPLLRSKAVRLVKIDPRLTAGALKDKLSQALVVAIVQAVKVLGIHCAAQQVDSQPMLRWLTAVGCDLGQGSVLARPSPIERLAQAPDPA